MPSVLLGGLSPSDPAGSRAVRDAVLQGLPNHDPLELESFPDASSRLQAARRSDGIVMTGAPFPRAAGSVAVLSALARRPLALLAISVGPVRGSLSRSMAHWAAGRADLLLVDDERSVAHLAAAGAPTPMRVSADPAWLALRPCSAVPRRGESVAVVLDGRIPVHIERALAAALVTVARAGRPVRIIPWTGLPSPDAEMATRLVRVLGTAVPASAAVEPPPMTLGEAASLVSDAHAVVAVRHRAIHVAAAAGVPVIAIPTDPRTAVLAGRLGQRTVAAPDLAASLPIALERIGTLSAPSPAAVADEMARARAGLRLLRLVVEPHAVGAGDVDHLPLVPEPWLS